MSFDKIFSMMYRLNEGRFGVGGGNRFSAGNSDRKIVAVAKTDFTFRIKLVGDWADYIVSGRLTKAGYDGIINWINTQSPKEFLKKYEDINLKDKYFLVYEILKDREDAFLLEDKQVFEFTITERSTVRNLSKDVNHVTMEELELIKSGGDPIQGKAELTAGTSGTSGNAGNTVVGSTTLLNAEQIKTKGGPSAVTAIGLKGNTDSKVIVLLTTAYNLIKGDATAGTHPGMPKVRNELEKDLLDTASQAFVCALNAGFGILDAKFQETPDKGLNTSLISKIMTTPKPVRVNDSRGYFLHPNGYSLIKEEASAIIGFNADAFVAQFTTELAAAQTKTGDIVVPAEGFKFDNAVTKNPELAKFQTILKNNMLTAWGGAYTTKKRTEVSNFCKSPKAGDGGYGTLTQGLIGHIKRSLTNEKYPDNDPNTIKPDFVNRMLKEFKLIKESNSYHGLDSRLLLSEDIEQGADPVADVVYTNPKKDKVYTPKEKIIYVNSNGDQIESNSNKKSSATGKYKELQNNSTFEYTIKNNVWHCRKQGTTDAPFLVTNVNSIKALVKTYFSDFNDGYFIMLKDNKRSNQRLYRFVNKKWEVQLSGVWRVADDQQSLINIYGTDPIGSGASSSSSSISIIDYEKIFKEQYEIGGKIKGWFKDGGEFSVYAHAYGDAEYKAWEHLADNLWPAIQVKLNKHTIDIDRALKLNSNDTKALIIQKNGHRLSEIFTVKGKGATNSNTFKDKMLGETSNDIYTIELRKPSSGSNAFIDVNTDFGK